MEITLEDDEGVETSYTLPSKYEVCPRCKGHGTHLTPSIGNHAYSAEEFNREFDDPEDRAEYFKRGGMYDVQCERCQGLRVVDMPDEEAIARRPDLAAVYKLYEERERARAQMEAEDRHTRWMEDGCPQD